MEQAPTIIGVLIMAFNFVLMIAVKLGHDRIRSIEDTAARQHEILNALAVNLPTNYITSARFREDLNPIHQALRRIEDKVDGIALLESRPRIAQ